MTNHIRAKKRQIVYTPCAKCGLNIRFDFDGYCMDCADELGLTEFSYWKKAFDEQRITREEWKTKLEEIMEKEPVLVVKKKEKSHGAECKEADRS